MLDPKQRARISRKSSDVLAKAIDDFPNMLATCDSEAAAKIVADLIKVHITSPEPEVDPGAALAEIMERCCREDEESQTNTNGGDSYEPVR